MSQSIALQKAEQKNYTILLVDDNPSILKITYEILEKEGYQVTTAFSGEEAIEALHTNDYDLVITDLNMGQINGIAVLKGAKELNAETKVIIMTGNIDITFAIEALRLSADDYLLKPFSINDLLNRVTHCLEKLKDKGRKNISAAFN